MIEAILLGLFALLAAALMLGAHYAAPRWAGRELKRWEAYVIGCALGVLAPFAGWHFLTMAVVEASAAWLPAVGLFVIIGGAGAGTMAGYWIDARFGSKVRDRALERRPHDGE